MKNILFLLGFFTATAAFGQAIYGENTTVDGAIPATSLTSEMQGRSGPFAIKIKGTVTSVCQKEGCWLLVDIGREKMMRVRFKDHAFVVPKNIAGKTAVLDGYAFTTTTSVAMLRHYAMDTGKSQDEIEKITEPEVNLNFEARSVVVM